MELIDKQKAIDTTWKEPSYFDPINVLTEVRERIRALPTIPIEQKIGEWVVNDYNQIECNRCGGLALTVETGCLANRSAEQYKTDYCPHCGADMRRSKGKTYV